MPSTRKAVISSFSAVTDTSTITIQTVQIPSPSKSEVQVSVIYAGFSGADINMRMGKYPMQRAAPLTPGYCCLGRVSTLGAGATRFAVGDLVVAVTVYDSDADLINIPEKYLTRVPEGLDLEKVAALPLDWNTAYAMVKHTAKVTKGQRVFVHGLSGAVGYATMSLCQLQGATVYGTASERNHAALRALGAVPFVYTDKKWIASMEAVGGAHAVFDPLGFESWDESYSILSTKEPSILVGYGGNLAALTGEEKPRSPLPHIAKLMVRNAAVFCNKSTSFYYITRDDKTFQPDLLALMELVKQGKIAVPIKHVWDLEDIQEAHGSWGKSQGMGSVLVRVAKEEAASA